VAEFEKGIYTNEPNPEKTSYRNGTKITFFSRWGIFKTLHVHTAEYPRNHWYYAFLNLALTINTMEEVFFRPGAT